MEREIFKKQFLRFNQITFTNMNGDAIGFILTTTGEILLGLTVLIIHWHILKEHKIDEDVLKQMKKEQVLGVMAVTFIAIGFLLQISYKI